MGDAVSGFTPGPWGDDRNPVIVRGLTWIASANYPTDIGDANARLIAAAPDLLEALKEAREMLEWYETALTQEDFNSPKINAAISKATGEAK